MGRKYLLRRFNFLKTGTIQSPSNGQKNFVRMKSKLREDAHFDRKSKPLKRIFFVSLEKNRRDAIRKAVNSRGTQISRRSTYPDRVIMYRWER